MVKFDECKFNEDKLSCPCFVNLFNKATECALLPKLMKYIIIADTIVVDIALNLTKNRLKFFVNVYLQCEKTERLKTILIIFEKNDLKNNSALICLHEYLLMSKDKNNLKKLIFKFRKPAHL